MTKLESRSSRSEERQELQEGTSGHDSRADGAIRGVRVLVVDDDEELRTALSVALEAEEASVTAVSSVDEAISAIDRRPPEVVVSDLGMPRRDGYDLIRNLRARSAEDGGDVPAIAITAFSGNEVRLRSIEAGFQCCAQKPVDSDELVAAIATLAGRA